MALAQKSPTHWQKIEMLRPKTMALKAPLKNIIDCNLLNTTSSTATRLSSYMQHPAPKQPSNKTTCWVVHRIIIFRAIVVIKYLPLSSSIKLSRPQVTNNISMYNQRMPAPLQRQTSTVATPPIITTTNNNSSSSSSSRAVRSSRFRTIWDTTHPQSSTNVFRLACLIQTTLSPPFLTALNHQPRLILETISITHQALKFPIDMPTPLTRWC